MARKVIYDSSNEEQVRAAEKDWEDRYKDIDFIMGQPRGRRWIYELIYDACHIEKINHVPGCSDSTAFNEGARSVGLKVLEDVRTRNFGLYLKMMEENANG
jgi:hypothetical protein